jgi:hypothetical protein
MKNVILLGLFILFLVVAQFAQAQTVDEVINKHINGIGGKEKISKIQNVVMEGTLNYQGNDVMIKTIIVQDKLNRQDISAGGMTGFDMLTDKDGWSYMPFFGMSAPEAKPAEEVTQNKADLDIAGPLVDYAAKGHKAELMGKEDISGKSAHKVKLTLAGGKVVVFFIDAESGLILRTVDKRKVQGQETDLQTDFADYKEVEGVKMAFSITQQFGTVYMSSIKANQAIPESAYKHDM